MSNQDLPVAGETADKSETVLRFAVLGVLYAVALFVVVAFSPSMGFVKHHPSGEASHLASASEPGHR